MIIHYENQVGAWLMLGAVIFPVIYLWAMRHRTQMLGEFADPKQWRRLSQSLSSWIIGVKALLISLIWMLIALAYMQPYLVYPDSQAPINSSEVPKEHQKKPHDVIFLLDASASMSVTDMRTGQSRFEFAKEVVDSIISRLQDEDVGLYAFTSILTLVSPITQDHLFVRLMLRRVTINEGDVAGTDFKAVFETLKSHLSSQPVDRTTTLLLLSDGGDTKMETLSGVDKAKYEDQILEILNAKFPLMIVGVGSESGGDIPGVKVNGQVVHAVLEQTFLQQLAQHTHGRYFYANQYSSIVLAEQLATLIQERNSFESVVKTQRSLTETPVTPLFQIPLLFAIFLLLTLVWLPEATSRSVAEVS